MIGKGVREGKRSVQIESVETERVREKDRGGVRGRM